MRLGDYKSMTSNLGIATNVALAGVALLGAYYLPYGGFYVENLEGVKDYLANSGQAMASEAPSTSKITPQKARDIIFLTASLIYETKDYADNVEDQEEAFRYIATSMINKKNFENKATFQELITEKHLNSKKKMVCQYSWLCETDKPADLKHLQKSFPTKFALAYKMAVEIVQGSFEPVQGFDGAFYITEDAYLHPKAYTQVWLKGEIQAGRMCKRRTIDSHVHAAPKMGKSCKQNQLAFYTS
jgi:hypothetical protein